MFKNIHCNAIREEENKRNRNIIIEISISNGIKNYGIFLNEVESN